MVLTNANCITDYPNDFITITNTLGKSYVGKSAVVHPDWSTRSKKDEFNLVLIKFEQGRGELISPVCIPESTDDPVANCQVTLLSKSITRLIADGYQQSFVGVEHYVP